VYPAHHEFTAAQREFTDEHATVNCFYLLSASFSLVRLVSTRLFDMQFLESGIREFIFISFQVASLQFTSRFATTVLYELVVQVILLLNPPYVRSIISTQPVSTRLAHPITVRSF
jgi:hypothetical protein